MERAFAYVRVSTMEQAREGSSLDAQENRIHAYCKMNRLKLVVVIREEGVSAGKPLAARPGGQDLLRAVASQQARHVVALKLDRLFRDAADALNQTRAWDRTGIPSLHLVDMGGQTLNTATAMGRVFLTMTAAFAELERNLVSERTQAALLYKKSKRLVYGAIPYGYSRYGDALHGVDLEFGKIRQIQDWHTRGWPLRKIAYALNAARTRTKNGRRRHASTIRYILRNPLYRDQSSRNGTDESQD